MIPLITLRGALADPALLGNSMPGPTFLPMQTLLIVGMGETLTDDERVIFTRLTGRPREPQRRVNELVIIKGRRAGGSLAMGKVIIPYLGGLCRWPALTGGERGVLLVLAQDQRTADQILDYAEDAFRASPMLSQLVEGRVQRTLRLTNGIDIEVRAADRRRLRGLTFVGVVADEFAHWPTDEWSANPDTEILNAVRPGLATTNGMSFLITSPYARRGEAWNIHKNDFGPNGNPLTLVAQGASRVFNSSLPQSFIDREYERDPAAAAAEYGAEFRLDVESFVSQEVVAAATVPGRFELPPISGVRYVAFTDPSGGSSDSMTLGIAHAEDDLVILDVTREVTPPFSPDVVVSDFAVLMKRYRIPSVTGDRWGGEFVREQFEKRGITYRLSEKVKSDIYRELLPLLNSGRIALLDLPRLANQLVGLERRTARGGRDSIDHAPKGHDDVIQSPDDTDEGLNQIKTFLRNRLDPADFDRLEQMLAALNGGEREPDDSGSMHAGGQDEPEPFRGRPQAGGRVRWDEDGEPDLLPTRSSNIPEENRREIRNNYAQDSRGGGYFAMFPSNAKVVTSNYGG